LPKGLGQNLAEWKVKIDYCRIIEKKYGAIGNSYHCGMAGGKNCPTIATSNFTYLEKKDDKSNRYWLECKHCPTGSDRLQNHDNKHIKHLADPKQCPNAPADVRKQALIYLVGKNAGDSIFEVVSTPRPSSRVTPAATSTTSADGSTQAIVAMRERVSPS
jgi:hypothetical protein